MNLFVYSNLVDCGMRSAFLVCLDFYHEVDLELLMSCQIGPNSE